MIESPKSLIPKFQNFMTGFGFLQWFKVSRNIAVSITNGDMRNGVTLAAQYARDIHSRRSAPPFQRKRRVALNRVSVRLTTWSFMFIISTEDAYDTVPRGSKSQTQKLPDTHFPRPTPVRPAARARYHFPNFPPGILSRSISNFFALQRVVRTWACNTIIFRCSMQSCPFHTAQVSHPEIRSHYLPFSIRGL